MKNKIPLIVIILGIVLIAGGVIFVWKYADKESLLGIKFGKKIPKISQENLKDSDNDGLKDWEEELYKTDINNPDTDGDGYLDGEEIDSGNNPLIKAPGDKFTFYPLPLGDKYNITKKVLTDEMINSLFDSYIAQKGQFINDHPEVNSPETFSAAINESTIQEMARRALADSSSVISEKAQETISQIPEIFDIKITDDDIKISQDNSKNAINFYISQVSSFLNSDSFFLQEKSSQVLISAFKNNDFSKLDELIKLNDEKIEQIKEITVPSSWKEVHKKGLELTLLIRNIFVSFRGFPERPVKNLCCLR